jgi:hypothetical protein
MSENKDRNVSGPACDEPRQRPQHGDGDVYWCDELLGLAGEDLLRRVGDEVDLGLEEIEYKGLTFQVRDDHSGWYYHHHSFSCRDLEDVLLYLEGVLSERNEVVLETTSSILTADECHGEQESILYNVDLDDALGNWESDYLYGIPLMARFENYEDAKGYVVGNLLAVAKDLMRVIGDVQKSETFDDLNLCCCSLITEERTRND